LIALYDEAIETMQYERKQFEQLVQERLDRNAKQFSKFFDAYDKGMQDGNLQVCLANITDLAQYLVRN